MAATVASAAGLPDAATRHSRFRTMTPRSTRVVPR